MTNYKYLRGASISDPSRVIFDIPDTPTIGTATDVGTSRAYNNGAATVTITGNAATGGPVTGYTVTSSPDGFTGSGTSPVTVTGLSSGTSYTFTAQATNSSGNSPATTATSAITATTVPQAPTIGTFTDGGDGVSGTLSFTAGATGGKSITGYKVSTDGSTYTTVSGTTSPLSLTGLTPGTYNFTLKATNANGDSSASGGVSGTVALPSGFYSIATATVTSSSTSSITFSSIPSGYTHLQIRASVQSGRTSNAYDGFYMQFNADTGSNYAYHQILADNRPYSQTNSATSQTSINIQPIAALYGSSNFTGNVIINIPDYSNSNKNKTVRTLLGYDTDQDGIISGGVGFDSGLWQSTSSITSITFSGPTNGFTSKTQFALYGVK